MIRVAWIALTAALGLASPASAQEPALRTVEAQVTSVSGDGVYLDRGRDAHIEPGDQVRLYPVSGPRLQAVIESVSRTGSRARLVDPDGIGSGDRAEVLVPEERFAGREERLDGGAGSQAPKPVPVPEGGVLGGAAAGRAGGAPEADTGKGAPTQPVEHPPWTAPPPEWDVDVPLLAPPESSTPKDRESRIEGRVYVGFDLTEDRSAGGDRSYSLGRAGLDARQTNPFGRGGELELDLELFQRSSDGSTGSDDETEVRIDRFSYAVGGVRDEPRRIEVGRFLQDAFPEFGVLDGVEYQQRAGAGRFGASLGLMPEHDATFETGDDLQGAVFYRRDAVDGQGLDWGVGYQKSFHQGAADRDLVVADGGFRPSDRSWYWGTAFVDYYTAGDEKSGVELTELRAGARWKLSDASGLSVDLIRVLWPDLDRWEYTPIAVAELKDTEVTRVGASAWFKPNDALRLSGRINRWADEDDDGLGGELRADWYQPFWESGRAGLTLFHNGAAFGDVTGLRLDGGKTFSRGHLNLAWELARHEQTDFSGEQEQLLQHALRGSWDMTLGNDWNLSLSLDQRFGDEQDSYSLGFFLQRRF